MHRSRFVLSKGRAGAATPMTANVTVLWDLVYVLILVFGHRDWPHAHSVTELIGALRKTIPVVILRLIGHLHLSVLQMHTVIRHSLCSSMGCQ